jgi:hypothetical protein
VVREGAGQGGEMNKALYAHMYNKRKMKKKISSAIYLHPFHCRLSSSNNFDSRIFLPGIDYKQSI